MHALGTVAAAATSGKSLKRRNMAWLIASGILDILVLLVVAFHTSIDDLSTPRMTLLRGSLTTLLPVPILLLSYMFSHDQKARLVFWRWTNPLPGSRSFSTYAPADRRIDLDALKKNIGPFPESEAQQNAAWYRLYKQVQSDVAVLESHQNYLLFRDIAAMSLLLVPIVPLVLFFFRCSTSSVLVSAAFFLLQYFATVIAARNNGVRFVQNVLAIHATQKIGGARRPPAEKRTKPTGSTKRQKTKETPDSEV
jgi:hypothetical protein